MEKKSGGFQDLKKIVIIGPESTGKSTLCEQLARHYNTVWCPEYAREFLSRHGNRYSYDDLLTIAQGQLRLEDELLKSAGNGLYFIDTNMYVMQVWSEYVFGRCHQFILDKVVERKYDLYLLCAADLPWSYDELREYPDEAPRIELYNIYKSMLVEQNVPWTEISGSYEQRFSKAIQMIDALI